MRAAIDPVRLFKEKIYEKRNILAPFPQWRDLDRYNIKPVIQVVPELSLLDELFKFTVRGGDYPDIHLYGFCPADTFDRFSPAVPLRA